MEEVEEGEKVEKEEGVEKEVDATESLLFPLRIPPCSIPAAPQ